MDHTAKSETFSNRRQQTHTATAVLPTDNGKPAGSLSAPTSDSIPWLTVGTPSSGVVPFNFALNASTSSRSANLTVLGVQTPVNQGADVPSSIAVASGSGQSTTVNTAFTNPLKAVVKDASNNPISGVTVTFTPPVSGASGTFAGGVNTAVTDATGTATSVTYTANTISGSDTVTASVPSVTPSASFTLTNSPGPVTHFTVSPSTNAVTAGNSLSITVTALDQFGNTATGYRGTVTFTKLSNPSPSGRAARQRLRPSPRPNNGRAYLQQLVSPWPPQAARPSQPPTQSPGSITGNSNRVASTVTPAARHPSGLHPAAVAHGHGGCAAFTSFSPSPPWRTRFGNITATGYSGTAHFTSTDAQAVLPSNSTLSAGFGSFQRPLLRDRRQPMNHHRHCTTVGASSISGGSTGITVVLRRLPSSMTRPLRAPRHRPPRSTPPSPMRWQSA